MREAPWLDPRSCPSAICSRSTGSSPARASVRRAATPVTPPPTTTTSASRLIARSYVGISWEGGILVSVLDSGENGRVGMIGGFAGVRRKLTRPRGLVTPLPQRAPLPVMQRNGLIAYRLGGEIGLVSAVGSYRRVVSRAGVFDGVDWSQDGTRVAVESREHERSQLVVMDVDSGVERTLESRLEPISYPCWSPAGTQL